MAKKLTKQERKELFLYLADHSVQQTAEKFGFDKRYSSAGTMRNAVYKEYAEVRDDHKKYGLSDEDAQRVFDAMQSRRISPNTNRRGPTKHKERAKELEEKDFKELALSGRDRMMHVIHMKLDEIEATKKGLQNTKLGELATVYGILFDKAQIVSGQATENIAVLSKNIDDNMNPDDALDTVLKMREQNSEQKNPT